MTETTRLQVYGEALLQDDGTYTLATYITGLTELEARTVGALLKEPTRQAVIDGTASRRVPGSRVTDMMTGEVMPIGDGRN